MSLTLIIIIVTGIVSYMAFNDANLKFKLIHNPYNVSHNNEYYRLLTSGFIHADFMHLILNMFTLYFFGSNIENAFSEYFGNNGPIYFAILYVSGIILSSIPDTIINKNNSYYNSLGASGGVSSIVFASIIISPLSEIMIMPIPIPIKAYIYAVLFVGYSIYMEKRQGDNVNHMAHLWGALWGIGFMIMMIPGSFTSCIDQIKTSLGLLNP